MEQHRPVLLEVSSVESSFPAFHGKKGLPLKGWPIIHGGSFLEDSSAFPIISHLLKMYLLFVAIAHTISNQWSVFLMSFLVQN